MGSWKGKAGDPGEGTRKIGVAKPRTGDGRTGGEKPKGVVFRSAKTGRAVNPPKAGTASRLYNWLTKKK